jgi:EPS-associated MarR family transcriptional regulator
MASRRPTLLEDTYLRTLRLIEENPRISQRDLATRIGISVGAAHYCLAALAEKGLIKLGNFSVSKNKRGYVYLLTAEGMAVKASLTVTFLKRKLAEYEALRTEIEDLKSEIRIHANSLSLEEPAPLAQAKK